MKCPFLILGWAAILLKLVCFSICKGKGFCRVKMIHFGIDNMKIVIFLDSGQSNSFVEILNSPIQMTCLQWIDFAAVPTTWQSLTTFRDSFLFVSYGQLELILPNNNHEIVNMGMMGGVYYQSKIMNNFSSFYVLFSSQISRKQEQFMIHIWKKHDHLVCHYQSKWSIRRYKILNV